MCVTLALQTHVLGSLGFRVSPARFHMNDAVFARLDKVQSPLWMDELRAPNQSISTCAVFESGMWSVASERATWLDHPRYVRYVRGQDVAPIDTQRAVVHDGKMQHCMSRR